MAKVDLTQASLAIFVTAFLAACGVNQGESAGTKAQGNARDKAAEADIVDAAATGKPDVPAVSPAPTPEQSPKQDPKQSPTQTPGQTPERLANLAPFLNKTGEDSTYSTAGFINLADPFFQSFGSNGRSCGSCHDPKTGMSMTPALLQQRFTATNGTDPVFRTNDGSVSPHADVSTVSARRSAYAMLLTKGLIRVGLPMPAGAEFSLVQVDDPYDFASAQELSLFRRPLPSTNLSFLTTVMWDGRESAPDRTLTQALMSQANDATTGHAQGQPLPVATQRAIVAFEMGLFTAQTCDVNAGDLTLAPARGGPVRLSQQPFIVNNPVPGAAGSKPFDPQVFQLFSGWQAAGFSAARASVARGEQIFNTRQFNVTGVKGLNDLAGRPSVPTTCSACHNTPNAGSSSVQGLFDIGQSDGGARRTADLPLYTMRNLTTGETVETTDPGRALITGKWADIGRFKVPTLRSLAARAPYFHNGSAADLSGVVNFYNQRFQIGLSAQDMLDLEAFLRSL